MPLNDGQAEIVVELINSAFVKWRQGSLTPPNISDPGILDDLIDSPDRIKEIPHHLLCQFLLLVLSDNDIVSLHELLQAIDAANQPKIRAEYTRLITLLFDAGETDKPLILEKLKRFIFQIREASSLPPTPKRKVASGDSATPNSSITSPGLETVTPKENQMKIPLNLHEMLDLLGERLNDFEYVPRLGTPTKHPHNRIKLRSLTNFLTAEAVRDISFNNFFGGNEDLDQLQINLAKLDAYLVSLKKLAGVYVHLLSQQEIQKIGNCNKNLQEKIQQTQTEIRKRIEILKPAEKEHIQAPLVKAPSSEDKPYVIIRFYREKGRVQEIHDVDSHGHLLLIVNFLDESTGQYKKLYLTLRANKHRILEERNYPSEVQIHKLFSRDQIPSGNIFEGYFLSEVEVKEMEERPSPSGRERVVKEVRLEQDGLDYQAIGKRAAQYMREHPKGSENPFRYCFYRSNDADNCASLIYKLMELGGATQYATLKKEWGHITPKNVFAFCKAVETSLSGLALAKSQMQTQADHLDRVAGQVCANFASELGKDATPIIEYKSSLDAGKAPEAWVLPELKSEPDPIAAIIKQLYSFSYRLRKSTESENETSNIKIFSYVEVALQMLGEIKATHPGKEGFIDSFIQMIEELQKSFSNKHRLFPLEASKGLTRIEVEHALKRLTQDAQEQRSIMYHTLQMHQQQDERSNIPPAQISDARVLAALVSPTNAEEGKGPQHIVDEAEKQVNDVVNFMNAKIHITPTLLGDKKQTEKYKRIIQVLNYFHIIHEVNFNEKIDVRRNLFATAMNIKSAILRIRELQNAPIKSIPNSFYELVIQQMQRVIGEINRLIYFDLNTNKDPSKSNLNLTAELSVTLGQDAAPLNVNEVLKQAEKTLSSQLPDDKPVTVHARNVKQVNIPQRRWSDYLKFWDYESNWYAEVATRKSIAVILKDKKLSSKQQQQKISKIIADAKPSVLKVWRRAEYDRYTELERQAEAICLTKSFIQGESDEVDFITDLLGHFNDYPPSVDYQSQIGREQGKGAPMLENLISQYQENVASLEIRTAQGTSYSFIESILKGDKYTPRSIPTSHDTFDYTLSSLKPLLKKSIDISNQLKQPEMASKVVSEQVAQAVEARMGLRELRR